MVVSLMASVESEQAASTEWYRGLAPAGVSIDTLDRILKQNYASHQTNSGNC